ncbi:unnamed protein product, partial [Rotaria sp. Silwood1]
NDDKLLNICVIHITPTRLLIMPKEKSKGHRAMRHECFQGEDNFCLVYLKSDPPDINLNDNVEIKKYFEEIFQLGINLNGNLYHLFK